MSGINACEARPRGNVLYATLSTLILVNENTGAGILGRSQIRQRLLHQRTNAKSTAVLLGDGRGDYQVALERQQALLQEVAGINLRRQTSLAVGCPDPE